MTYSLRRSQWIARPIGDIFPFFSDAQNLERITPPWLGFKILFISTPFIEEGTTIRYRLRLHGLPIYWRTRICEWNPPHSFVDEQTEGPYKRWRHTHTFESHGVQTKMVDEVLYEMPFGVVGQIVHAMKVRRDVRRIFDYRAKQIDTLFGHSGEPK